MRKILCLLICTSCLLGCNRLAKESGERVAKAVEKIAVKKVVKLSEKDLGKALTKSLSVLPQSSKDYLIKILSENPKLLAFFKENPTFVSTWEYMRKYLPQDCMDPNFLKMIKHANKYSKYSGNKLENFIYKKLKNESIEVVSKDGKHLLATIKPGNIIEVVGDDVNNWFLQLKPFANAKYVINGAEYLTDDTGRIIKAKSRLKISKKHRDSGVQKQMGKLKGSQTNDHAGHLIGDQFGGSSNMVNLVPMSKTVNTRKYKALENLWRDAVNQGKKVDVEIKLKYPTKPLGSERPDWIEVIYDIDGKRTTTLIKNID